MSNVHVIGGRIVIDAHNAGLEEVPAIVDDIQRAAKKIKDDQKKVALVKGRLSGSIYGLTNYSKISLLGRETYGTYVLIKPSNGSLGAVGRTETGYKEIELIHEVRA